MGERLAQLGEAMDRRDLLEVVLLAVAIFVLLRLLGRAAGPASFAASACSPSASSSSPSSSSSASTCTNFARSSTTCSRPSSSG